MKAIQACFAALTFLVAATAAAQQPQQDAFERVLREKKIRFGYIPSPPGAMRDAASGQVTGFYIDAARTIAEMLQVEPIFVETTWANFTPALQAGQFDVSIAATFATIARATSVAFTKPIHYQSFSGIIRKGEKRFSSLADLNKPDIRVAVVQGSAGHEFARQNLKEAKLITLGTPNLLAPFLEVSAGRADVGIQDDSQVRKYSATHPEVDRLFQGKVFNTLPISWAVRRQDHQMLNFMNTAIDYMLISGRWDELAGKYGPTGRYRDSPNLQPFGSAGF